MAKENDIFLHTFLNTEHGQCECTFGGEKGVKGRERGKMSKKEGRRKSAFFFGNNKVSMTWKCLLGNYSMQLF